MDEQAFEESSQAAVSHAASYLVALVTHDGREPAATLDEAHAACVWSAVTALWHPALLARSQGLPRIEAVDSPSEPIAGEVRVVAEGPEFLPHDYQTRTELIGAFMFSALPRRDAMIAAIWARVAGEAPLPRVESDEAKRIADDFLALGAARWWLRDLTVAMGHVDLLDHAALARETLAGARAWSEGDDGTAANRLRAAFEVLTQAREKFYPVDAYLLDLNLIDVASDPAKLHAALAPHQAIGFIATAGAIEALIDRDPTCETALKAALTEGWADIAGGSYAETDEPLLPWTSILWQFERSERFFNTRFDGKSIDIVARRRFALYPMLPQIAKRFGIRFALPTAFDDGRFPLPNAAKRLWESPDSTSLEALTSVPLAANAALPALTLPWRLAATMKDDHVATLPFVRWVGEGDEWYADLRRAHGYSPVLGRMTHIGDYFHMTDRPFESFRPASDDFKTPYLAQATARGDVDPISRRVAHAAARARIDALGTANSIAHALSTHPAAENPHAAQLNAAEELLETDRIEPAKAALDSVSSAIGTDLAAAVIGAHAARTPGYLVLNMTGVARRAVVELNESAGSLSPAGPLLAVVEHDAKVEGVVELPAFGFAWIPRATASEPTQTAKSSGASASKNVLRNQSIEVEIDETTGGIRAVRAPGEESPRLAQQLALLGFADALGQESRVRMEMTSLDHVFTTHGGCRVKTAGRLIEAAGGKSIASFTQEFTLWSGRPILEIDVRISEVDAEWLRAIARGDAWSRALVCRWAWPDSGSQLRRTCQLAPEHTEAERPETADAIDISTRSQRTALLFGGLAHHRRHGSRMLDTILIAGREECRHFRFGVALDLEYPHQAAVDFSAAPLVVPTSSGPPAGGPSGWFFHVDHKGTAALRASFRERTGEGRGWGVVLDLIETAGRPSRCRVRAFKPVLWARQVDFRGHHVVDLPVDGDAALVDFTPREVARVELTLGEA